MINLNNHFIRLSKAIKIGFILLLALGYSLSSMGQDSLLVDDSLNKEQERPAIEESLSTSPTSNLIDSLSESYINESRKIDSLIIYDTVYSIKRDTVYLKHSNGQESSAKSQVGRETNAIEKAKENRTEKKKIQPLKTIQDILSLKKIFWILIILLITYYFLKAVKIILRRWAKRKNNHVQKSIPFIQLFVWIFSIFIIEQTIIQLTSDTLFALLASTGIAIGIAAQDVLKNIFGGLVIIFDRPFQIGDKIEVDDFYGEVKEIGLRSTQIVTPDDSVVSIPNAEVVNKAVSNSNSGENNCQVVAEIYLPVDIDTNIVRKIALETAQTSRYIYLNKPITVLFFHEIKERNPFLKMRLKAYVSDLKNEFLFKSDLTEIFLKELYRQKIIKK